MQTTARASPKSPAVQLGTKTIRVNRKALEEYLQRSVVTLENTVA